MSLEFIRPGWTVPERIRAVSTLRPGGASPAPWASLNLGHHVGDDPDRVAENRRRLREALGLDQDPVWLEQVHGTHVLRLDDHTLPADRRADAATTDRPGRALVVLTADCLPVLLCRRDGRRVGVAHAGWRGLAAGVLEATVASMDADPEDLAVWLGPSIGPGAYEVGEEVRRAFVGRDPVSAGFFRPGRPGHWQFDLPGLARHRTEALGIGQIHAGQWCTFSDPGRFFSHRRDGPCGRMATLVWMGG
jgi:YfiH family protein